MKLSVTRLATVASAIALFASPATAQVNFQGYTNGCFYDDGAIACTPAANSGFQQAMLMVDGQNRLTFVNTNGLFNLTSVANVATFTGTSTSNLGYFQRGGGSQNGVNLAPYSFNLRVAFTAPATTSPSPSFFSADVTGILTFTAGTAFIDFGGPQTYAYNGGTFTLTVNDVVAGNSPSYITGSIAVTPGGTITTAPEPSTYALMAAGLAGLGIVARRRRKA